MRSCYCDVILLLCMSTWLDSTTPVSLLSDSGDVCVVVSLSRHVYTRQRMWSFMEIIIKSREKNIYQYTHWITSRSSVPDTCTDRCISNIQQFNSNNTPHRNVSTQYSTQEHGESRISIPRQTKFQRINKSNVPSWQLRKLASSDAC